MLSRFVLGAGILIAILAFSFGVVFGLGFYRPGLPVSTVWALFFLFLSVAGMLVYGAVVAERDSLAQRDRAKIHYYLILIILGTLLLSAQSYWGQGSGNAREFLDKVLGSFQR